MGGGDDDDPCNLYFGYLPNTMLEEDLGRLIAEHVGEAPEDVKIIKDKFSGQSKGFGFVRMASEKAAMLTVQKLDSFQVCWRTMIASVESGGLAIFHHAWWNLSFRACRQVG